MKSDARKPKRKANRDLLKENARLLKEREKLCDDKSNLLASVQQLEAKISEQNKELVIWKQAHDDFLKACWEKDKQVKELEARIASCEFCGGKQHSSAFHAQNSELFDVTKERDELKAQVKKALELIVKAENCDNALNAIDILIEAKTALEGKGKEAKK